MLIRMLSSIGRWDGTNNTKWGAKTINGDAIADLRTSNNELSVWSANSQQEKDDAVVALALNRDKVTKLNYVELDETALNKLEIMVSSKQMGVSPGLDPMILQQHRDLIDLDFWHIGFLAEYIVDLIRKKGKVVLKSQKEVKNLLVQYKEQNKINVSQMNEKLKKDLNW